MVYGDVGQSGVVVDVASLCLMFIVVAVIRHGKRAIHDKSTLIDLSTPTKGVEFHLGAGYRAMS